jgi:hypothetical protein
MADYDQYGNPIPPSDAQAAREAAVAAGDTLAAREASVGGTSSGSSDPMSPDYVSPDVVTVTAPAGNSSWIGMAIIAGLLYFLLTGEDS